MSVYEHVHRFRPDASGRCTGGWFNNASDWVTCGSKRRVSDRHLPESDAKREERPA